MLLFGGGAPSTPRARATMRLRPRPRLRARARDRSLDRNLLVLRCDPEQYSTLLWPLITYDHSCITQELACYTCLMQESSYMARGFNKVGYGSAAHHKESSFHSKDLSWAADLSLRCGLGHAAPRIACQLLPDAGVVTRERRPQ